MESRAKLPLVVINDWGSKPFLDTSYPALKALGVPVTWAVRPNRLGTGTYPANHISLAEARTLANENGNVISFHSFDGQATSGMTAEEIRVKNLSALASLHAQGLFGRGSTHGAAWTQNEAPNAPAVAPYLAVGQTNASSSTLTPWPPLERLYIPRIIMNGKTPAQMDERFQQMKNTGEGGLFYTHGVLPASEPNHSSQAEWDYSVFNVQAGITEGWLEPTTLATLMERERVEMPAEPL
ncbi:hypothetical protein [Micrococcus sp. TA1]|uniref:hypothetical protein n=1 Tax=Micrococcus sp. TA1 TaxID=681627 RepID=UPI001607C1B8|nr:hypothetical protein [Micrococcus sp. TA1]MBB5749567.1 hypothetical protein [Micrococcus sp. TA1]